jgi:hypothetical protein
MTPKAKPRSLMARLEQLSRSGTSDKEHDIGKRSFRTGSYAWWRTVTHYTPGPWLLARPGIGGRSAGKPA